MRKAVAVSLQKPKGVEGENKRVPSNDCSLPPGTDVRNSSHVTDRSTCRSSLTLTHINPHRQLTSPAQKIGELVERIIVAGIATTPTLADCGSWAALVKRW